MAETRAGVGLAVQKQIVGAEKVDAMYASAGADVFRCWSRSEAPTPK
jgi:hypothetical protein